MDPPYNTEATKNDGNSIANDKENVQATKFVYRDKYSRNGWLNLMNERLKLAKELLKDDGVIFVSIDDAEQAYLKVLMDEIFGEENFVASLPRITKMGGGRFGKNFIQNVHDYIHIYSKNKFILAEFEKTESDWNDYKFSDNLGEYTIKHPLDGGSGLKSYQMEINFKGAIYKPRNGKNWSFSDERINFMLKNNFLVFKENGMVYVKNYKKWEIKKIKDNYQIIEKKDGISFNSLKLTNNEFSNAQGTNLLNSLKINFDYPKSINLINSLISLINNKNAKVLDFFAGSGTTAHAVLELNKEDGGNRTFTLVTNNENNIGIDVNYERLYRINHGIGSKGETFEWTNKNEPYKSNLNVYNIKYYDISLFNNIDVKEIVKELIKLLKDFGVNSLSEESEKDYTNLLNSLLSLKPQLKENNESN
ncbi:site-specific DNA-methyltransferase [Mycoplasmopsis canis]|uniref:site-specific DNA-methyltransferase n=1 Tax=Mycoplasmopsis canis TaxID=29555 RepID=UPI001F3B90ED